MSPEVHDGCNEDNVFLDSVNQPVWKTARATTAVVFRHPSPGLGMKQNALYSPFESRPETPSLIREPLVRNTRLPPQGPAARAKGIGTSLGVAATELTK